MMSSPMADSVSTPATTKVAAHIGQRSPRAKAAVQRMNTTAKIPLTRTDHQPRQRGNGFRSFLADLGFGQGDLRPDDFLDVANNILKHIGQRAIWPHPVLPFGQSRVMARPIRNPTAAAASSAGPGLFFTSTSTSPRTLLRSFLRT